MYQFSDHAAYPRRQRFSHPIPFPSWNHTHTVTSLPSAPHPLPQSSPSNVVVARTPPIDSQPLHPSLLYRHHPITASLSFLSFQLWHAQSSLSWAPPLIPLRHHGSPNPRDFFCILAFLKKIKKWTHPKLISKFWPFRVTPVRLARLMKESHQCT
jgi:hypothetical protein